MLRQFGIRHQNRLALQFNIMAAKAVSLSTTTTTTTKEVYGSFKCQNIVHDSVGFRNSDLVWRITRQEVCSIANHTEITCSDFSAWVSLL